MNWEYELDNPPPCDPKSRVANKEWRHPKHIALAKMAANWATCPMSEIKVRKKMWPYEGIPVDEEIAKLGYAFHDHVDEGRWDRAKNALAKIRALTPQT